MRKEKLIYLVKGERKCLWMRDRIEMGSLRTTRAAALHLTSAEREFPFPGSRARLCRQPGECPTQISCDEVWKSKVPNRESWEETKARGEEVNKQRGLQNYMI